MQTKQLGVALMLIGVIMVVYGTSVSLGLVTVITDDTPPEWNATAPPNGASLMYTIDYFRIHCKDLDSGIDRVLLWIDGNQQPNLIYKTSVGGWEIWQSTVVPASANTLGSHTFKYRIINGVVLSTDVTGSYIRVNPPDLEGNWFINTVEITSPTQTFRTQTLTLTFKFVKTAGPDDSGITCTVQYSGPETGTLTLNYISANTWQKSKTFQRGTYQMILTATDGTSSPITYSIVDVYMGGEDDSLGIQFNMWQWTGLALMGVGSIFTLKGKQET